MNVACFGSMLGGVRMRAEVGRGRGEEIPSVFGKHESVVKI